jgi:hypothetical protein
MDLLTFTAEVVKALAWPSTMLVLAFLLRKPITQLLPNTRRLKYKELEMEFSKEIAELKADAKHEIAAQGPDQLKLTSSDKSRLLSLVSYSTRAAIIEAWVQLETAAAACAAAFWNSSDSSVFKNYAQLGEYLLQCRAITPNQLEIFNKLRELRNKAAHTEELNLSENDARVYVELAAELTAHIRSS